MWVFKAQVSFRKIIFKIEEKVIEWKRMELKEWKERLAQIKEPRRTKYGKYLAQFRRYYHHRVVHLNLQRKTLWTWRSSEMRENRGWENFWNCQMEYRIMTRFGEYLNDWSPKHCRNAYMTDWDVTEKKVPELQQTAKPFETVKQQAIRLIMQLVHL